MIRIHRAGLFATLALVVVALLGPGADAQHREEVMFAPAEVETRVDDLAADIDWNTDLPTCLEEAQADGKLVVWIHVVGDLFGGL